jgi:hypothetical protein
MDREKLIRETFELDRDVAFRTFRRLYIENPEIVQACPDPAVREKMLRGFRNQDAEKRYPEYREKSEMLSTEALIEVRDELKEVIAAERFQRVLKGEEGNGKEPQEKANAKDKRREI